MAEPLPASPSEVVLAMRRAFDSAFAAPPRPPAGEEVDMLIVRVGDARYALRLTELAGLQAHKRCVPLPGAPSALLGIVGIRGRLVPVYDLAQAFGLPPGAPGEWLALARGATAIALTFTHLERYVRVPHAHIHTAPAGTGRAFVRAILLDEGESFGILDLSEVVRHFTPALSSPPAVEA